MNLSDLLTHIEWLVGGVAATALIAFGAVYWVWNYGKTELEKAVQSVTNGYQSADSDLRGDLVGVRNQVIAFQTDMYTKGDGGALETKLVGRMDRLDDKIDDIRNRFEDKFDEFMRNCK